MDLCKAQVLIWIALATGFVAKADEPDPDLDQLDPNVFKSLEKTKLMDLKDNFTNEEEVTMDYLLTGNTIEEVFTPRGEFGVEDTNLVAHLPETTGTLTGKYDVKITKLYNWGKPSAVIAKKSTQVRLRAKGDYTARIKHVDLRLKVSLPEAEGKNMGLQTCHAEISTLDLTLTTEDEDEEALLTNLKEKLLTGAMKKGFSTLFCDTMNNRLQYLVRSTGLNSRIYKNLSKAFQQTAMHATDGLRTRTNDLRPEHGDQKKNVMPYALQTTVPFF